MTRIRMASVAAVSMMVVLAGCSPVPTEAGFPDVQKLVADLIGQRVHWNRGTPEDARVAQAVLAMLSKELTVDEAVQIALLNNRSLQATYEDLGIAQADVVQAGLLHNPVFFASARFSDTSPSATNTEFEVAADFLNILMVPARKRIAATQFERTKLRVGNEVLNLAAQVRSAYYSLLGAKQVAAMRWEIARAALASFEMAERLNEAGNLSDLDMNHERGLYEQARVDAARTEAQVRAGREQMNRLMGLWGQQTAWKAAKKLPDLPKAELPLDHVESLAIEQRLDLAVSRKETEAIAQALQLTRDWRWLAVVDVGVSTEHDTDRQSVTGPNLTVELPIFDQRQAVIARLEAQLRQSEQRLAARAVDIRAEVRAVRDRLLSLRQLVEHYRDVVIPVRERIVELTQQQYNFMLVGVFELLAAKQNEYTAYQQYIEAVRDYWIARADLQRAAGGRLPAEVPAAEPDEPTKKTPEHKHHQHRPEQKKQGDTP